MTMQLPPSSFDPGGSDGECLLAVACPACHAAVAVTQDLVGGPARCPLCTSGFLVPTPPRAAPTPAESAPLSWEEPAAIVAEKPKPAKVSLDESRRTAREERAVRRARRNMVMLVAGVCFLLAFVIIFGTKRRK